MNPLSIARTASKGSQCFLLIIMFLTRQVLAVDPNTTVLIHSKDQTFSMGQALGGKV
jgi:hypothetical protein